MTQSMSEFKVLVRGFWECFDNSRLVGGHFCWVVRWSLFLLRDDFLITLVRLTKDVYTQF